MRRGFRPTAPSRIPTMTPSPRPRIAVSPLLRDRPIAACRNAVCRNAVCRNAVSFSSARAQVLPVRAKRRIFALAGKGLKQRRPDLN
jgi:hypothetical protein